MPRKRRSAKDKKQTSKNNRQKSIKKMVEKKKKTQAKKLSKDMMKYAEELAQQQYAEELAKQPSEAKEEEELFVPDDVEPTWAEKMQSNSNIETFPVSLIDENNEIDKLTNMGQSQLLDDGFDPDDALMTWTQGGQKNIKKRKSKRKSKRKKTKRKTRKKKKHKKRKSRKKRHTSKNKK
jgi:hypothetical protein